MNFVAIIIIKLHVLIRLLLLVSLSLCNAELVNLCNERVALSCVCCKIRLEVGLLFMHVGFVLKGIFVQYLILFLAFLKPIFVAFVTFELADYLCLRIICAYCAVFNFYLV